MCFIQDYIVMFYMNSHSGVFNKHRKKGLSSEYIKYWTLSARFINILFCKLDLSTSLHSIK